MELLRTTTPEPSPQGISWHVEKDVSDYMTYILDAAHAKRAVLSIPNVVDKTYTGVLYVNATLSFYGRPFDASDPGNKLLRGGGGGNSPEMASKTLVPEVGSRPPIVVPLAAPSMPNMAQIRVNRSANGRAGGASFWASMAISGDEALTVPLPTWPQPNIARVLLDLYASPHECEEVRRPSGLWL